MKVRIPKGSIAEHNTKMLTKEQSVKNNNIKEKLKKPIAVYCRVGHPDQLN